MKALHAVHSDFAAGNTFLNLTLGALSLRGRFTALLDQYAPEISEPQAADSNELAAGVELFLGLIALSERVGAEALAAAREPIREPAEHSPQLPESFLR